MEQKQIDQYLFEEMPEGQRSQLEEAFLTDDDLFFEIVSRENELVDAYANGGLDAEMLQRFEKSLASNSARRNKIANAKILRGFIAAERNENKTITIAERSGLLSKLTDLFSIRSPALQFASIGLIALLALASLFLLIENRRLNSVRTDLAAARVREAELVAQIENEREASGDLSSDLNSERARISELEEEITKLSGKPRPSASANPPQSTIATLILSPITARGGQSFTSRLELPEGVTRAAFVINLPAETGDTVGVRLNGESVADNLHVRTRKGDKSVSTTIPITRIKDQLNKLEVVTPTGEVAAAYSFTATRK
jgi:hypothetical protein